jgi:ATP-dependent Zn protease
MASEPAAVGLKTPELSTELATQWRALSRAATAVALATSPALFLWFHKHNGWSVAVSLLAAFGIVVAFRGLVDVVVRKMIPWPSLFGTDDTRLREEDVLNRRRSWFWRRTYRWLFLILLLGTIIWLVKGADTSWFDTVLSIFTVVPTVLASSAFWAQMAIIPLFFLINFLILFGPMMAMGVSQVQGFEPGDAEWGVRLDDVRGQAEAKEEVRRVVELWQSGEAFEKAGGKRERGLLFLGAPGTGKTMLSKAIATGFNSPFVSIPGSGFAQTFIGMDAVIVRWLAWKAKRLARKWGGQCIVFIDEIDAVGMRRQSLGPAGGGAGHFEPTNFEDLCFYGPWGSQTPSGDLILETRAWREKLFATRAPARHSPYPPFLQKLGGIVNQVTMPGMMGGGGLALNQLLVVMDGIGNPPFVRRTLTKWVNSLLDASYVIPRRVGRVPLRVRPARPAPEQIYFIGACNVPIEMLDPALTRPGRMGRHVWFRTPTKQDRLDIFDLYLGKVAHEPDLDSERRRDELARITMGYSPAMIEQVCSMALTYSHHEGRERFGWTDIVEAMTTVETGTAINIEYIPEETRAVAIHEAGHAVAAHVFMKDAEATRISIRRRGGSLGHHMALEKDERFTRWRSEQMAQLIWALGAMAAEQVFYDENSDGVGGDLQSATARAAWMVGSSGMGPEPIELSEKFADETEEESRKRLMKRFERIGLQLMNRTAGGGPFSHDPVSSVLSDPGKRATAAQILGQAYITAYNLIAHNRKAVEQLAERVMERKEIYGDELVELLQAQKLKAPKIALEDEQSWPTI